MKQSESLSKTNKETANNEKITPRNVDYSKWYLDVIAAAELADNSPVRGCMVIRPNGYAIWENVQKTLDRMFKEVGVVNAYFPLFIPKSFLEAEAAHVEGFAKECAVVTHHRLTHDKSGKLVPDGKLDEPLIVRPTSETIMYHMYAKWIKSHRDLPLLINQWCNVVRWELRTRPFLRTTEFLWQEGHTAHATKVEAEKETLQMLGIYQKFVEEYLAIPTIPGYKTESEKFAGADYTTTIEAMMQDGKALQSGTSHHLGQNFAKVFDVKFLNENSQEQFVWQTSWGLSTRIIGALIMAHSDDTGLVLPPKIAPTQVVIVSIMNGENNGLVVAKSDELAATLRSAGFSVKVDSRDGRPGARYFEWERKGVPVRIEVGPKDIANQSVMMARRDTGEKKVVAENLLVESVRDLLDAIQINLFDKALAFQKENTHEVNSYEEFQEVLEAKGGFLLAHWCGDANCEAKIKEETKASSRCIPFDQLENDGQCIYCGKPSKKRIIFAKAY
ncbi:MAG: proline--tRNA ligase [Candidatus Moraniibacteriota bacterium]